MKRQVRWLSLLLCIVVLVMQMPITANAASYTRDVRYLDAKGTTKYIDIATEVTADDSEWTDGWYYAYGSVIIDRRVTVNGKVHLILGNGCNLTVNGGIQVQNASGSDTNQFTIYAQSTDESTMGKLTVQNIFNRYAGIGGGKGGNGSYITINGGIVTTSYTGWVKAAGIGGGCGGSGSNITINGGIVKASGGTGNAAGIGGGEGGHGENITINGGTVEATGSHDGAGIGGGSGGSGNNITINGGTVTATGGAAAAI